MMRFVAIQFAFLLAAAQDDSVSLMQVHQTSHPKQVLAPKPGNKTGNITGNSCSDLKNQGSYFTVEVGVGTPSQTFNLVADTGSDALIIPDCRCVEHHYCRSISACFAPEDSGSFLLDEEDGMVLGASMDYGSGEIQVLISSDHVNVAGMTTNMKKGVFLMEDRRELDVHGDFEGILGLGMPHQHKLTKDSVNIPSFMDEASEVASYSMCFNEWPHPGAIRTWTKPLDNPMQNVGQVHWGLAIEGFSIGGSSHPIVLCDPTEMPSTQQTPCGAIPDSGTTLLMGPKRHIHALYARLCERWPRCKKTIKDDDGDNTKSKAFHNLLRDCVSWMGDLGVTEVPSLFVHMAGSNGNKQSVELTAWSFIVETSESLLATMTEKLYGTDLVATDSKQATKNSTKDDMQEKKKVCSASFGPQHYETRDNGPVWILGSPLFYAHSVGYSVKPPMMSFMDTDCSTCSEKASLLSTDVRSTKKERPLRQLSHIKESHIDTTKDFF